MVMRVKNEADWFGISNPFVLLRSLPTLGKTSLRQMRLFAIASCRRIWDLLTIEGRMALETVEQFAEGLLGMNNLQIAKRNVEDLTWALRDDPEGREFAAFSVISCCWVETDCAEFYASGVLTDVLGLAPFLHPTTKPRLARQIERRRHCLVLRDIVGNPWRPIHIQPCWRTANVLCMAKALYNDRALPSGELNMDLIAILADLLEDTGCSDIVLLNHLRCPTPHVRGCHIIEALLNFQ